MITVYFDASYNQASPSQRDPRLFYTVGCYMGEVDSWRKFRKEWRVELDKRGISDFHMNKFERARSEVISGRELKPDNPYRGWTVKDFDSFVNRLHKVLARKRGPRKVALEGLGCSLSKADFHAMLPDELRDQPECQSEYIFNVAINMQHAAMAAELRGLEGKIHYVFASGDGKGNHLQDWFRSLWRNKAAIKFFRLSKSNSHWGYEFTEAAREPAIQAADIAAYEFNKLAMHCAENNFMWNEEVIRKSVVNLCRLPDNPYPLLLAGERIEKAFEAMIGWKKIFGASYADLFAANTRRASEPEGARLMLFRAIRI